MLKDILNKSKQMSKKNRAVLKEIDETDNYNNDSSNESDSSDESDLEKNNLKSSNSLKMKNSKEKDNIENTQSSQKKRGRPKKNVNSKQIQKPSLPIKEKEKEKEKEQEEEQLILRIPIFDDNEEDNSSDRNMFTMKDESDYEENFKKESFKLIDSLTETENNESDSSNEHDTKSLLLEIKKRDQVIKKLKFQLTSQKPQMNEQSSLFTNESLSKLVNLKLFDINNNNMPVVVEKTNVACWYCSYNFDTIPCFVPDRYINGKFYVFGCFCTYSCAMKYNRDLKDYRVDTRTSLIKDLCNTIFGNTEMCIEAPEKEQLEKFGGPMSIDDFRNHKLLSKKDFKMKIPPMIPLLAVHEESFKDPSMNSKPMNKFRR